MIAARPLVRLGVGHAQGRIVPAGDGVEIEPGAAAFGVAETLEHLGDVALGHLELVRHRDAVAVVPDREQHRRLQHAHRVDRLPEHAFGAAGVADGAERHLVAVIGEAAAQLAQPFAQAIDLRRPRQTHQPRHLRRRRRQIGGRVVALDQVLPGAVGPQHAGGEVAGHRAAAERRLRFEVGVGVELGEELAHRHRAQRQHEGLIAVVARPDVASAEGIGHRQLGHLLAVAEDPELGAPGEHLGATQNADVPAADADPIVAQHRVGIEPVPRRAVLERAGDGDRCGGSLLDLLRHAQSVILPAEAARARSERQPTNIMSSLAAGRSKR